MFMFNCILKYFVLTEKLQEEYEDLFAPILPVVNIVSHRLYSHSMCAYIIAAASLYLISKV